MATRTEQEEERRLRHHVQGPRGPVVLDLPPHHRRRRSSCSCSPTWSTPPWSAGARGLQPGHRAYKNPLVHLLELGLVTAVLFHSLNGLKITLIDFFPSLAGHIRAVGRTTVRSVRALLIPVTCDHGQADHRPVVRSRDGHHDRTSAAARRSARARSATCVGGRERPIGGFELWVWLFMRISGLRAAGARRGPHADHAPARRRGGARGLRVRRRRGGRARSGAPGTGCC